MHVLTMVGVDVFHGLFASINLEQGMENQPKAPLYHTPVNVLCGHVMH